MVTGEKNYINISEIKRDEDETVAMVKEPMDSFCSFPNFLSVKRKHVIFSKTDPLS